MSNIINFNELFANTEQAYVASCLKQRNPGPESTGSVFTEPQTVKSLCAADWVVYNHPAVSAPAQAFKASISGRVGLVALAEFDPDTVVTLDDRKAAGFLEVVHTAEMGPEVGHTTLLAGPDREDPEKLVLWTFFPGDPIVPSKIPSEGAGYGHGDKVTAAKAIELGLEYAKVESGS